MNGAPPPANYMGLANQQAQQGQAALNNQTQANRPNQSNPYASSTWSQGPNGEWSQQTAFTGPMAGLNSSLQSQAAQAMSTPFSLGGLPGLSSGEQAREQAINAAYGSATSRLDPAFTQREDQLRNRLMGQGLTEGSQAWESAMADLGRERNDAYGQALSSAIGQGTQAGQALFGQSMAARQQGLSELLRQRGQAMGELQGMQGLTGQAGFMGAGLAPTANLLGAAGMQDNAAWQRFLMEQQQGADAAGGGMQALGTLASLAPFFLCDARAKQDIHSLAETLHSVPMHMWRYRPEHGDASALWLGVLAQDVQRLYPEHVRERGDGLLEVHPLFAPVRLA